MNREKIIGWILMGLLIVVVATAVLVFVDIEDTSIHKVKSTGGSVIIEVTKQQEDPWEIRKLAYNEERELPMDLREGPGDEKPR